LTWRVAAPEVWVSPPRPFQACAHRSGRPTLRFGRVVLCARSAHTHAHVARASWARSPSTPRSAAMVLTGVCSTHAVAYQPLPLCTRACCAPCPIRPTESPDSVQPFASPSARVCPACPWPNGSCSACAVLPWPAPRTTPPCARSSVQELPAQVADALVKLRHLPAKLLIADGSARLPRLLSLQMRHAGPLIAHESRIGDRLPVVERGPGVDAEVDAAMPRHHCACERRHVPIRAA
jgi:hypothetical protein